MPFRLSELRAAAQKREVNLERPSKGSHWKFRASTGGNAYTVPAGNGEKTEISDMYVRGLCRAFGWDFDEFICELRGVPPPKAPSESPPPRPGTKAN